MSQRDSEQGTPVSSGQGSYDAHLADLEATAQYLAGVGVMLERIHAQMLQADMGAEVRGEVSIAQERAGHAAEQIRAFRAEVSTVNSPVRDARRDSGGQAAANDYLTGGR